MSTLALGHSNIILHRSIKIPKSSMGENQSRGPEADRKAASGSAQRSPQPQRARLDDGGLLAKFSQCTGRIYCNSNSGGTFILVTSAQEGYPRTSLLTAAHVIRPLLGDIPFGDEEGVKKAIQSKSFGFQMPESNAFPELRFSGKDLDPDTFFHISPPRKLHHKNLDFLWVALSNRITKKMSNRIKLKIGLAASSELAKKGETVLGAMFLHKSQQIIPSIGKMEKPTKPGDKTGQYKRGGEIFDKYMRKYNGAGGASGSPVLKKGAGVNDAFLFGLHYKKGHFTLIESILAFVEKRISNSKSRGNMIGRQRRSRSQTPRERSRPHTPSRRRRSASGSQSCVTVEFKDGNRSRPFIWVEAKRLLNARGFVKNRWLVDTGARRSAITEEDARKLKLLERGRVAVRNATTTERRALAKIQVCTLLSGKPSDRSRPTSKCELEVTIRGGGIKHSILGMDWISKVRPSFKYPD